MREEIEANSQPRGLSLWTALTLVLGVALLSALGLGVLIYYWKADQANTRRRWEAFEAGQRRLELTQKEAAQAGQLAQARNRQNAVLAQARHATNLLGQLLHSAERLTTEASALRTNEAGTKIAPHADLVDRAARLYDTELRRLPSVGELRGKLENARRIEQQMLGALGTTYEPDPDFAAALQTDLLWSGPEWRQVEESQALLTALVQEGNAKKDAPTLRPEPPTLEAALVQLAQQESVARQQIIAQATAETKPQATQLVAEAERERILQEARWQVTNVLSEMRVLLEQQNQARLVREAEFQRGVEATQLQVSNVVLAIAEMRRQHGRETTVREGEQEKKDMEARLKQQDLQEQARQLELRRRAQEPRLQALLAPFTTPGYRQFKTLSYEKQPFSYTELQSIGALQPTLTGLRTLVLIATSNVYQERPRWQLRGGPLGWRNCQDSIDLVKEAQQALSELGPVLVELKMLAP
ncbi:MAG: hypothetical protein HZA90_17365 [Verrucomicrobia bacterium]|nr:hypothetical protein [Verrucomicrobiota bacterium]